MLQDHLHDVDAALHEPRLADDRVHDSLADLVALVATLAPFGWVSTQAVAHIQDAAAIGVVEVVGELRPMLHLEPHDDDERPTAGCRTDCVARSSCHGAGHRHNADDRTARAACKLG